MQKKRTDGYYRKTFTYNGKRYSVYAKSKSELDDKVAAKKAELISGMEKRVNPTLKEYSEKWLESKTDSILEATLRHEIYKIKSIGEITIPNIKKKLYDFPIRDIIIDDLRYAQKHLSKRLQSQSVNDCFAALNRVFKAALKERVIDYNPCVLINTLKRTEEKARDTYHRALSVEETKLFFENIKNSHYYNIYRLAIYTGMRIGDIGALKYSDIKDNYINVVRTLTKSLDGKTIIGKDAKTKAGKRKIPITKSIGDVIADQKKKNAEINGKVTDFNQLLFTSPYGNFIASSEINREIKKKCDELGIDRFTIHAFRDTFATRALESGMDVKTLQEILGHSNFAITMDIYAHVMDGTKAEQMEKVIISI